MSGWADSRDSFLHIFEKFNLGRVNCIKPNGNASRWIRALDFISEFRHRIYFKNRSDVPNLRQALIEYFRSFKPGIADGDQSNYVVLLKLSRLHLIRQTFDMRSGRQQAKPDVGHPLDGRVSPTCDASHVSELFDQPGLSASNKSSHVEAVGAVGLACLYLAFSERTNCLIQFNGYMGGRQLL